LTIADSICSITLNNILLNLITLFLKGVKKMKKTDKKINEQKYGTVEFGGRIYILTQQAYCDNYGTDGGVRYYAHAVAKNDADTNKYKVVWATTDEWDNHQKNDETCSFCEDESNACNWDNPIDVRIVG
jgi:hypothetical protein